MVSIKRLFLLLLCCLLGANGLAQKQDSIDKQKLRKLIIGESVAYAAGMTVLGTIWYGEEASRTFTFFNDNQQWNQLDKAGHVFTAYHLSAVNARLLSRAGIPKRKAYFLSGITSTAMMLPIEIFDGFSPTYGASWSDAVSNAIGAFMPFQELLWDQQYIHLKYSFSQTSYAAKRPEILGNNLSEQWLKDYNGQTYWVSTNFNVFSKSNIFPRFLMFSFGYGADEMLYGSPDQNNKNGFQSYRQLYFSLDFDFSEINTNNKWLKALFYALNLVKVPLPALEINKNGLRFHPIYF